MCIALRDGVEIWLEDERATNLKNVLKSANSSKFVDLGDEIINTADIIGIFKPETMDAKDKKKRGWWLCKYNKWHAKNETCECGRNNLQKY